MTDLIPTQTQTALGAPARARIEHYLTSSRAAGTRRVYASCWQHWLAYCAGSGQSALPATAEGLADYLSAEASAGAAPGTLQVRLSAIGSMHRARKLDDPTKSEGIRLLMSGIRRAHGVAQRKAAPVTRDRLRAFVGMWTTRTLTGLRNRAMLLAGFAGAMRESELAKIEVQDIQWQDDGSAMILIRKSKTDQEGRGILKPLPYVEFSPYCPASAMRSWLTAAGIESGPVWRRIWKGGGKVGPNAIHPHTVYQLVKDAAERAGLDPAIFSGHSLRAGFATQYGLDGGPPADGMQVTGHKDMRTFMGYMRAGGRMAKRASVLALTGGER